MSDRLPPSRYSVIERGGRLVVIDRDTGTVPPTAAERMAEHDRRMGHEPHRPTPRAAAPEAPRQDIPPAPPAHVARQTPPPTKAMASAVSDMNGKRPWANPAKPGARPDRARAAQRPARQAAGERKQIVTGKWWDAKGPRTIELGPKGQQVLSGGFVTLFFAAVIAATVLLFISPLVVFAAAFLIFRFGNNILGPIGAGIIDKALAEKG